MAQPTRGPRPIVSDSISDVAAQSVLDGLDAGFTIDEIALELGMSIDTAPYEAGWPIERDKQHTQDLSHVEYSKQGLEWHREINGIKLPQQIRMA